jgi:small subunit ribosomal protein S1
MTNEAINQTEESAKNPQETQTEIAASAINEQPTQEVDSAEETSAPNYEDFAKILEHYEQDQRTFHTGEIVEGKVVGVSEHGVLVDFGFKSEGLISAEEFASPLEESVKVGDTVEAVIKSIGGESTPILSRNDALNRKIWTELNAAYEQGKPVKGKVVEKIKGGLKVDLGGIEAFLPGSLVDSRPVGNLDPYIGQEIEAKILKLTKRRTNVVLSRKAITDELISQQKSETLSKIDVGYIVEGTVKNLTEYGAFVDIGGIDGLLHVTDMSWARINHPGEMLKVGDRVQAKVLKLDREKEKVSLGMKQLLPDPWSTVIEMYPPGSKVAGKISSITDYGIFVELEPGVEGLVHVSEISWSKRSVNPKKLFKKGDEIEVQVLGVDSEEKRISLGIKQLHPNPWDTINERYPVGTKIRGKVRNLTDFGAFIEIEEGIDGLVHVSDISWSKKIKHPKEVLKKDQEVEAVITNIDRAAQRLSLSIKDLTPSAWETFVATHRPGDVVRGKVSRFTSFGVFVELSEGLEGLCHISELSDQRIEKPSDVVQIGQEADFRILRIENAEQKIGLSYRAVGKEDEPIVDTRIYSTDAKSGMASLGELANLTIPTRSEKQESKAKPAREEEKSGKETLATEPAASTESENMPTEGSPEAASSEEVKAEADLTTDESVRDLSSAETAGDSADGAGNSQGETEQAAEAVSTDKEQAQNNTDIATNNEAETQSA